MNSLFSNAVLDVIESRSSLRSFSPDPLTPEEEETILHAAMRAPTAAGLMLYSILIIRDPELRQSLSASCNDQKWIASSPFLLIFLADHQRWEDYYAASGVPEKCEELGISYLRPGEQSLLLAACDALFAAQNAVLAAESIGIGSCYIGHIMDHYEYHRDLLQLPPYVYPVTMAAFGHPADGTVRKITPRKFPEQALVYENHYHRLTSEEQQEAFSAFPFSPANSYHAENAGQQHYLSRHLSVHGASYAEGIRSLREALKNWQSD